MRIGKTDALQCDFCGEVVVEDCDYLVKDGEEHHFCRGSCMDEYLFETHIRDKIEEAIEPRVREEFNTIHKQVCPACRYRLQKLV